MSTVVQEQITRLLLMYSSYYVLVSLVTSNWVCIVDAAHKQFFFCVCVIFNMAKFSVRRFVFSTSKQCVLQDKAPISCILHFER